MAFRFRAVSATPGDFNWAQSAIATVADYPAVGDVQESVDYANGSLTGTLGLPAVGEVLDGVGYGEDDTEFEGTYGVSVVTGATTPLERLQALVASSPTFQAWVSEVDADGAAEHVYVAAFQPDDNADLIAARPFALVRNLPTADDEHEAVAGAGPFVYQRTGALVLLFEGNVDEDDADDAAAAETAFTDQTDAIIAEMKLLAGTDNYLTMTSVGVMQGPARSDPKESQSTGDYFGIAYRIGWGGI